MIWCVNFVPCLPRTSAHWVSCRPCAIRIMAKICECHFDLLLLPLTENPVHVTRGTVNTNEHSSCIFLSSWRREIQEFSPQRAIAGKKGPIEGQLRIQLARQSGLVPAISVSPDNPKTPTAPDIRHKAYSPISRASLKSPHRNAKACLKNRPPRSEMETYHHRRSTHATFEFTSFYFQGTHRCHRPHHSVCSASPSGSFINRGSSVLMRPRQGINYCRGRWHLIGSLSAQLLRGPAGLLTSCPARC